MAVLLLPAPLKPTDADRHDFFGVEGVPFPLTPFDKDLLADGGGAMGAFLLTSFASLSGMWPYLVWK